MTRLTLGCPHQRGVIYVIPADKNWVCGSDSRFDHSTAGFMEALTSLNDPRIDTLMQEWGLYYRTLPIESESED